MKYYALLLTHEESRDARKCGFKFAIENKDRWREITMDDPPSHIGTYDVSTTYIVFDNIAYTIFKDYVFPDDNQRVYILKDRQLENDIVE